MELSPEEIERREAIYDRHALAIGKLTMAWNDAQIAVFGVFRRMSGMGWDAADAVFFSIRTDSAQRDMTAALARATVSEPLQSEIISEINALGKLAAERNAAIHTAWYVEEGASQPAPYLRNNPPKVLKEDVIEQFEAMYMTLVHQYLALQKAAKKLPEPSRYTGLLSMLEPEASGQGNALRSYAQSIQPPPPASQDSAEEAPSAETKGE